MREEGGWGGAQDKDILTDRSGIDTVAPALNGVRRTVKLHLSLEEGLPSQLVPTPHTLSLSPLTVTALQQAAMQDSYQGPLILL